MNRQDVTRKSHSKIMGSKRQENDIWRGTAPSARNPSTKTFFFFSTSIVIIIKEESNRENDWTALVFTTNGLQLVKRFNHT